MSDAPITDPELEDDESAEGRFIDLNDIDDDD